MKNISLILLLFILFSCKSTGDKTDCEVLHVDLVERPVPTEELFSKISVIPLETNDSSFLVRPVKVIIKDNRYYIVDEGVPAVFSFDEEGHLLHKIGKKPLLKKKKMQCICYLHLALFMCILWMENS